MNTISEGKILIAHPHLTDDFFYRAVILICEYNEKGALGFILNNKPEHTIADATDEFGVDSDFLIYNGGPVNLNDIHFIHTRPDLIKNGKQLTENLFWNGNNADVIAALKNKSISQNELKFFHGYCGWDENLLEQEIAEPSWIICKENDCIVMSNQTNTMWQDCFEAIDLEL